jgi:hypothetical protein
MCSFVQINSTNLWLNNLNPSLEVRSIPEKLDDWNLQVLENLIKIKDIEGESFDFKREIDSKHKLNEDICAMANVVFEVCFEDLKIQF